mmetsp:Transcript_7502/g.18766  ORF Transcript_7502/g.18766 Transcript_7502/m.18766 type:complete len:943 (-) Transcript_7502:1218-4046(-)
MPPAEKTPVDNENEEVDSPGNTHTIREGNSSFSGGFEHRMGPRRDEDSSGLDNGDSSHGHTTSDQNETNAAGETGEDQSIELQFVPPDQRSGQTGDLLLAAVVEPEIEDDTEAAEALRANSRVKVGKVSKAARGINAQTVRKLVKRASLRGYGMKRGKPPRVPPGLSAGPQHHHLMMRDGDDNQIYSLEEGEEESDGEDNDASATSPADIPAMVSTPTNRKNSEGSGEDKIKMQGKTHQQHSSFDLGDPSSKQTISQVSLDPDATIIEDDIDIPQEVVADTREVGRKLMGAIDPHNMLQDRRWRKKKKDGKKERKSYVKGKVIDGRHELYALSIAVMLGVRTSIARTNTIISSSDGAERKIVSPQDFMAEEKYEFAPKGSATTPPHKLSHTFKFKDYAPVAFAYLRRMFGVNEFDFLLSVCGNANFIEFISNAKSGQFFFYSSDGKYMIKTMTNSESKFLRRILPHYFRHCTENPNTLLTKFYGMYRVKLYHLRRNVKFVIMNSVYYTDKSIQTFYDLKGSEIGRSAKPGQDVLKDNDLRKKIKENAFSFCPKSRLRFRAQIEADCNFLRKMQIMDYSMLIGIHHIPPKKLNQRRGSIADTGFKISEHRVQRRSSRAFLMDADPGVDSTNKSTRSFGSDGTSSRNPESVFDSGSTHDSTKHLIRDIRENAYSNSNFEFVGLLEDEDDCSYLEGSEQYNKDFASKIHAYKQHPKYKDIEKKKEQTIEQIYWPFHRFFDINGHRRMEPKQCLHCQEYPCVCEGVSDLIKAWNIPEFVPPLSNRKDGGIMMDTSHLTTPMLFECEQGKMAYEGKIYYMGIIDILQQYNARKRAETRYRRIEVKGKAEPSCVSPDDYAERFILFFDEYSQKAFPKTYREDESTGSEVVRKDANSSSLKKNEPLIAKEISNSLNSSMGSAKITPEDSKDVPSALKSADKPRGKYAVM